MKKWMVVFGIFDGVSLLLNFYSLKQFLQANPSSFFLLSSLDSIFLNSTVFTILVVLRVATVLSFLPSSYFLVSEKKTGLFFTYIQFPFRLLFSLFSLGFLQLGVSYLGVSENIVYFLLPFLVVVECGRLICSILIHRKFF